MKLTNYRIWFLFTLGIYVSLVAGSLYRCYADRLTMYVTISKVCMSGAIAFFMDGISKNIHLNIKKRLQDKVFFIVVFLISNVILVYFTPEKAGYLWIFPSIMVAISSGFAQAVCVLGALLLQNMLLFSHIYSPYEYVVISMFCLFCVWFFSQGVNFKVIHYMTITLIFAYGISVLLFHSFLLNEILDNMLNVFTDILSLLLLQMFSYFYLYYRKKKGRMSETERLKYRNLQKKLTTVLEADFGLLIRLQEYSGELFMHSMNVSRICARAARHMGADVMLCQAAGLYHEVGRIKDNDDYVVAGIDVLKEHDFPPEIVDIVKQQDIKKYHPLSLEAVIVYMSDTIITTNDYLVKRNQRELVSDRQLVSGIFKNTEKHGVFSESGMSHDDLVRLSRFFITQVLMSSD